MDGLGSSRRVSRTACRFLWPVAPAVLRPDDSADSGPGSPLDCGSMHGAIALVGGGEFQPSMEVFDRALIDATGRPRPRVVVVFAASGRKADASISHRAAVARTYFEGLGGELEEVVVRNRADADDESSAQAIGEADVIYLADTRPESLRRALADSSTWSAVRDACERGAVLVGCGGGAAVLGDRQLGIGARRGWPIHWRPALGVCPSAAVLPRYDRMPEPLAVLFVLHAPRDVTVVGIEQGTGIIGRDGAWQVQGSGRVTVWRGRRRERLVEGDVFRL